MGEKQNKKKVKLMTKKPNHLALNNSVKDGQNEY